MNWTRWERHAPLTGIAAVILWVVGIVIVQGPGHLGNISDHAPADILSRYTAHHMAIQWGAWLVMLGSVAFLWFMGSVRARLYHSEGGVGRVASIAAFGGVATGLSVLLVHAPSFAAAGTSKNLTPDAAKALNLMDDVFFYAAEFSVAVLFLATALAVFRWRAFPAWLGWVSLVFGVLVVIPPVGWAVLAVGLPLWTLFVAWLIYSRPGPPAPPPHTAQFVGSE
jgi:hypothetical protein